MSADQESKNTSQEETDPSQDEQSRASSDRESKGSTEIYRVNRLGREIFVGEKLLLIQAIQSRRVRGDDLIYDQSQDLWGFARKHPIFLEATGQGLEESKRTRQRDSSMGKWLRFLINAGIIGLILYFLISYSETIEFKLREEGSDFSSSSTPFSKKGKDANSSSSESDGAGAGNGSGSGDGEGEGEGEGAMGMLDGEGSGSSRQKGYSGEIKQIFDLNAEGMRDSPLVIENTLSDDELLGQAQYVTSVAANKLRDKGKVDQETFTRLQEARAVATFVAMRNIKHKGAGLLLSQIRTQLQRVCAFLYSKPFCDLKNQHPNWADTVILSIIKEEVLHGMTPQQVEAAWGRASRIRREREGYKYCYGPGCERSVWTLNGHVREIFPSQNPDLQARAQDTSKKRRRKRRRKRKRRRGSKKTKR